MTFRASLAATALLIATTFAPPVFADSSISSSDGNDGNDVVVVDTGGSSLPVDSDATDNCGDGTSAAARC